MANEVNIPGLPEDLRDIVAKLQSYGFRLTNDYGIWNLKFPEGDPSGLANIGFSDQDLREGLLRVLRKEEELHKTLVPYKQGDPQWGSVTYGTRPKSTNIAAAGCGPSSLAIVLQYLMNNAPHPQNVCSEDHVTPLETSKYAETHGRAYDAQGNPQGTAGDPMINGLKERWPDYEGARVTLAEATGLLQEGKLIIFLCKGCRGRTEKQPQHRDPNVSYGGHYMVLSGVEGVPGPRQVFWVVDPAGNRMHSIQYTELKSHVSGFWWVYRKGEPEKRMSGG